MSQIGIKLANRDFFPIINEDESLPIRRELELTTAKDGQATVQINLFRKYESNELIFIGSLVLEDLKASPSGDATIALRLDLDEMRELEAQAIDLDSGAKQTFSINIDKLKECNFLASDFDMENPFQRDDINETFSSSLAEIDEIDLSFTDIGTEGDVSEKSEGVDVSESFDSLADIDLADFDRIDEKNDLQNSDLLAEGSSAEFLADECLTSDFSTSDDLSTVESDNEVGAREYSEEQANDIEDWSSPSDELMPSGEMSADTDKTGLPTWLKIFIAILLLSLLVLVCMLTFRNLWKSSKVIEGQGMTLVELEEDSDKDKESEEIASIDSVTSQAPKKEKEPFKSLQEINKNVSKENAVPEEKPPKPKVQEMEEINREVNKDAVQEEKSLEYGVKEDEEKRINQEVKNVAPGAIKKSVRYRLRWGDTLWDLSETFYKTPWKYKKIARYNGIKNPNKIIVGKVITIPAK